MCTCTHLLSESPSYHMNWTENNKLLKIKDKTTIKQLYFPRELNIFFSNMTRNSHGYTSVSLSCLYIYVYVQEIRYLSLHRRQNMFWRREKNKVEKT